MGGLPESEAYYLNVDPRLPVGHYRLTVRDVPVDAFWSISLYNPAGYFEPNDRNANSVNSVTATPNTDGSITVNFGGDQDELNSLPIMDGWNYLIRLYQPHPEVINGSWTFPTSKLRSPGRIRLCGPINLPASPYGSGSDTGEVIADNRIL